MTLSAAGRQVFFRDSGAWHGVCDRHRIWQWRRLTGESWLGNP